MEEKIVEKKEGIFPLVHISFTLLSIASLSSVSLTLRLRQTYHPTLVHRHTCWGISGVFSSLFNFLTSISPRICFPSYSSSVLLVLGPACTCVHQPSPPPLHGCWLINNNINREGDGFPWFARIKGSTKPFNWSVIIQSILVSPLGQKKKFCVCEKEY